jgi:CelD/BcsL family acetyltransferase involved in cellulose biosynthesis
LTDADRVEVVAAAGAAAEWDGLADRVGGSPFMRPGWILAWDRAFGRGELELLVVRRDGRPAAILPVLRRGGALRSPTNWHSPPFEPLADDPAASAALATGLAEHARGWFDLSFLLPGDPFAHAVRTAAPRVLERVVQSSPFLEPSGDWEEYLKTRSSSRQRNLRRLERRLGDQGEVKIEILDGTADLDRALTEGFRLEAGGWKGERGTAITSDAETEAFYREVAAWAAGRDELRLWFMRVGGKAVAFAYCIETNGKLYELKIGIDEEYRRYAPGILLTRARLEHVFKTGMQSYEFLGAPAPHKLEWADQAHDQVRIQGFLPGPRGAAGAALWKYGRPLAKRLASLRKGDQAQP